MQQKFGYFVNNKSLNVKLGLCVLFLSSTGNYCNHTCLRSNGSKINLIWFEFPNISAHFGNLGKQYLRSTKKFVDDLQLLLPLAVLVTCGGDVLVLAWSRANLCRWDAGELVGRRLQQRFGSLRTEAAEHALRNVEREQWEGGHHRHPYWHHCNTRVKLVQFKASLTALGSSHYVSMKGCYSNLANKCYLL